jgi:hypothetical protein
MTMTPTSVVASKWNILKKCNILQKKKQTSIHTVHKEKLPERISCHDRIPGSISSSKRQSMS